MQCYKVLQRTEGSGVGKGRAGQGRVESLHGGSGEASREKAGETLLVHICGESYREGYMEGWYCTERNR